MGAELAKQFGMQPQALAVAAAIIGTMGLVPGLPHLSFLFLAALVGTISYFIFQQKALATAAEQEKQEKQAEAPLAGAPESIDTLLPLDILELEVGYGLIPLVDESQQGDLLERIRGIRRQFAMDMGLIIPPLHVRDNLQIKPDEYVLLLKGIDIARGELMMGYLLAMDSGAAKREIEGIPTQEPAFNLPALWIAEDKKDEAQLAGYTVVDPSTVVATHLTEVLRSHAEELLGRQDTQKLVDNLAKTHPKVVEELIPENLSLGGLQKVLQNLLKEQVSIRDMLTICETLADYGPMTKDPAILTEYVRQKLSRSITSSLTDENGSISVLTLATQIEDFIRESIQKTEHGTYLNLEPNLAQKIIESIQQAVDQITNEGIQPVVLCSPIVRRHVRHLLERFLPHVIILSNNELGSQTKIKSLGTVEVNKPKKQ